MIKLTKSKRRNPHIDDSYFPELASAIEGGNPDALARAIKYYRQGYNCLDCGTEYFICECEKCDECEYSICLCDLNILSSTEVWKIIGDKGNKGNSKIKQLRQKVRQVAWKLAKETLSKEQYEDFCNYVGAKNK